jgi:hypothetical protein
MLAWTINRNNEGPLNAYKHLGDDLSSGTPTTANENLIA